MPLVRLMNWNVQTFGPTKGGLLYNNLDIAHAVAKHVVAQRVDIFVMLEMNTTSHATAESLCEVMLEALQVESPNNGEWTQAVLSPNTGREFYAFFIRDSRFTTPVPLTGPQTRWGRPPEVLGQMYPIARAEFSVADLTSVGVLGEWFPLLAPDIEELNAMGWPMGVPPWPAIRRPALGLFRVRGARAANAYLPIIPCHFAAAATTAKEQFNVLPFYTLLAGLAPDAPAARRRPVVLQIDFKRHTTNYWVFTGDFNVEYGASDYARLQGRHRRQLGATAANSRTNTLLVTYGQYSRTQKNTWELAVKNLDNFFTRPGKAVARPVTVTPGTVSDIARDVQTRRLPLRESVRHYRQLDQRGFDPNPYLGVTWNFADQLTNRTTDINIKGALAGARLISDHLPVILDVTVL